MTKLTTNHQDRRNEEQKKILLWRSREMVDPELVKMIFFFRYKKTIYREFELIEGEYLRKCLRDGNRNPKVQREKKSAELKSQIVWGARPCQPPLPTSPLIILRRPELKHRSIRFPLASRPPIIGHTCRPGRAEPKGQRGVSDLKGSQSPSDQGQGP